MRVCASSPVSVGNILVGLSQFQGVCVLWQVVPDSDAHRAGLQEGDQVLSVNDVDFQDIEHSRVSAYSTLMPALSVMYF